MSATKERRWFTPWRMRSRKTIAGVIGLLVLLLAGGAIAAATVLTTGKSDADKKAAQQEEARARLIDPFQEAMRNRDALFLAERGFVGAMADANGSLSQYQVRTKAVDEEIQRIQDANQAQETLCETYSAVPCPNPTYPSSPEIPDVSGAIKKLREVSGQMDQLHAELQAISSPQELDPLYAQLVTATDSLSSVATHNADVLTEAVSHSSGGEGGSGYVDFDKIKTLRGNSALPAIRQMNRMAVQLIQTLGLLIKDYDVPGGHDIDPTDHSTSR